MIMPFGKYSHWPLEKVPEHYLRWVLSNLEKLDQELVQAIEDELRDRPDRKVLTEEIAQFRRTRYRLLLASYQAEPTLKKQLALDVMILLFEGGDCLEIKAARADALWHAFDRLIDVAVPDASDIPQEKP